MSRAFRHLLLYDGVCALCDRGMAFVLAHDARAEFGFAPLQGPTAHDVLARHGLDADALDSFRVVVEYGTRRERVQSRSRGAVFVLSRLPGPWRFAPLALLVPTALLDVLYDVVAAVRYRVFGRLDACRLPDPAHRGRFVDV